MANPLAALSDAGASNRDIVKVLKQLSTPTPSEQRFASGKPNIETESAISIKIEDDIETQIPETVLKTP